MSGIRSRLKYIERMMFLTSVEELLGLRKYDGRKAPEAAAWESIVATHIRQIRDGKKLLAIIVNMEVSISFLFYRIRQVVRCRYWWCDGLGCASSSVQHCVSMLFYKFIASTYLNRIVVHIYLQVC
jgi:hypothetical protein